MASMGRQIRSADGAPPPDRPPAAPAPQPAVFSTRQFKLHLAQNVASARHRAGLTQDQLAQAAELSRATVNLIEAGACDPRLSTITRLAGALQVDALSLLGKSDA